MNTSTQENQVTCHITVNRSLAPMEVIEGTGFEKHGCEPEYIDSMPKGEGDEAKVTFFNLGFWVTTEELWAEYARRGLKPADAYSVAEINRLDPEFSLSCANCTYWKDGQGNVYCLIFRLWSDGVKRVHAYKHTYKHGPDRWFAGVPA